MDRKAEIHRIKMDANEAKDRLYSLVNRLENIGAKREANSAMTLIYKIEAWQNKGC